MAPAQHENLCNFAFALYLLISGEQMSTDVLWIIRSMHYRSSSELIPSSDKLNSWWHNSMAVTMLVTSHIKTAAFLYNTNKWLNLRHCFVDIKYFGGCRGRILRWVSAKWKRHSLWKSQLHHSQECAINTSKTWTRSDRDQSVDSGLTHK